MIATVNAKNQITVPKAVRAYLRVGPGSLLVFEPLADGRVAMAAVQPLRDPKDERKQAAAPQAPVSQERRGG